MKSLKKYILNSGFIKSASIYTFSRFLNSAIPFLILPVLTRYLSTSEYGIISMFNATGSFLLPFITLGVTVAIQRKIIDADKEATQEYLFNSSILITISAFICFIIIFVFKSKVELYVKIPSEYVLYTVILAFSTAWINLTSSVLQITEKPKIYAIFHNLCTLVDVLLSVCLIVFYGMGLQGRIYGIVFSKVIFSIIGIFILIKCVGMKKKIKFHYIKEILFAYGIPMIPTEIKSTILTYIDRIFISNMISMDETGIYSVGNQFSLPIMIFVSSFNMAFIPWLYRQLKQNSLQVKKRIVKFTYLYFVIIIMVALIWSIASNPFIKIFVGKEFGGATIYVLWLSLGYAFIGMHMMVVNYIYYYGKVKFYPIITVIVIIINVVLNYVFINIFGTVGAALATMIADFVSFMLTWLLVMRICDMPWFDKHIFFKPTDDKL